MLCKITTAKTTIPAENIFSELWDTTAATIKHIATTDTDGRTLTRRWVTFPKSLLMIKPKPIGIITTLTMDKNILMASTVTVVLSNK